MALFAAETEKRKPWFLIVDTTEFFHRWADDMMTWRDKEIIPHYNAGGPAKFAFITGEGVPFPTVESGAVPAPDGPATFPAGWFASREGPTSGWPGYRRPGPGDRRDRPPGRHDSRQHTPDGGAERLRVGAVCKRPGGVLPHVLLSVPDFTRGFRPAGAQSVLVNGASSVSTAASRTAVDTAIVSERWGGGSSRSNAVLDGVITSARPRRDMARSLLRHCWHSAPDRDLGVAVRHQRCNQRLPVNVGQLQDLQAAHAQASFGVWLVGREGRLAVAGTCLKVNPVRAGRSEDCLLDKRRDRLAALEPGGERRHGEADVFRDELHEPLDVGEPPGPQVTLEKLLDPGVADVGLR